MSGVKPVPITAPKFVKPVRKIDGHVHLRTKKGYNVFTPEERLAFNEVMDIDHSLILTVEKPLGLSAEELLEDPRIFAEDAVSICEQFQGKFSWFCNLIPDGTSETYKILEKYKKMGAVGVGEVAIPMRFDDPRFDHMLDCCQSLEMPIMTHMNSTLTNKGIVDEPGLILLERALKKYPKLVYIGHSQPFWSEIDLCDGNTDRDGYNSGPVKAGRLVDLLSNYENLYGDLSANSGGNAIMRDPDFGNAFLEKFQDKLMYGTDTLSTNLHYPLGAYLDSLLAQNKLTRETYAKICRYNIVKLLDLGI
ncbi:MAG: amidohydrolase family protein [Clostridia bacterium]